MLNYYQTFLWPFLRTQRYQLPQGVAQQYYVSAEDALWHLTAEKQIPKGGIFLVPSFYCMDVVENIEAHGYPVRFYEVDDQLQISQAKLLAEVQKHQPVAVILFHAAGISLAACTPHLYKAVQQIRPDCLFLEDNVHRLTDPSQVRIFGQLHLIMDSLRKDSPLPGAFLYGTTEYLNIPMPTQYTWHWYRWLTLWWFLVFRLVFLSGVLLRSAKLVRFAHEKVLKLHDDLIGDVDTPPAGFGAFAWIHGFINFGKVYRHKKAQVARYGQLVESLLAQDNLQKLLYQIRIPDQDAGQLHVFPVGLRVGSQTPLVTQLLVELQKRGIVVWAKFPDCPWSARQAVLFLPLGFHVSQQEIDYCVATLGQLLTDLKSES